MARAKDRLDGATAPITLGALSQRDRNSAAPARAASVARQGGRGDA